MNGVLVHEWIAQDGGSENVLEEMARTFPEAGIECLWNDSRGRFAHERLHESVLARTPLRRHKAAALPVMPIVWRFLRDRGYEWALISSHAFAHHARFRGGEDVLRRMVYVHTPARYIWSREFDGRGDSRLARLGSRVLQPLDRRRAHEGAEFAANSAFVRDRVMAAWGVEARIVHPPVDVEGIQATADWTAAVEGEERRVLDSLPEGFVLGASRFIPYKRLEDVVALGEAVGRPVVLAGHGPRRSALAERARTARVPVRIVDAPSQALLRALYQRTSLYAFPAVEDFGIMPVEAMAAGAPVLAQVRGGAAESVVDGVTGALIPFSSSVTELREGAVRAMATTRDDRVTHAKAFTRARFRAQLLEWVGST